MGHTLSRTPKKTIREIYKRLATVWGNPHWWPAQSPFEVIVGAYLTQNTSWSNVELALNSLRQAGVLTISGIRDIPVSELEQLIRSSGYFRQKAARLKTFVQFLDENYSGSPTRMFSVPTERLREQLLNLNGVGPETADSILLYAGQHPVFVVDAYTRRLAARHEIAGVGASYEQVRYVFEKALVEMKPPAASAAAQGNIGACHAPSRMSMAKRCSSAQVYNEMHGFIVGIGKHYCRKSEPDCANCPLQDLLPAR